jgi:glycosyltransferase involved in cell wall biosynthesis
MQPLRSIALTRNKAIANSHGDFVAFIDDDEFPATDWLLNLFKTCNEYNSDGVLGPVRPCFDNGAPRWVVLGGFYERPMHPTGLSLDWSQTRTGNVLLKAHLLTAEAEPFRSEFRVGSDMDFFKRMCEKGHTFVWCNEAAVYEVVPPARWKRSYLIKKALFRGAFSKRQNPITISLIAAPAYAAVLPLALFLGQGKFMSFLFKFCYHSGRLLACLGIDPIKEPYVPE